MKGGTEGQVRNRATASPGRWDKRGWGGDWGDGELLMNWLIAYVCVACGGWGGLRAVMQCGKQ